MDYISDLHEPRTNAEQSETGGDLRGSFVSAKERRFRAARRGETPDAGAHLYFIRIGDDGPVKIGRAANVKQRLAGLQCGCPWELKVYGELRDCGEAEFEFHTFLRVNRMLGEWFEWTGFVANTVNRVLSGANWREVLSEHPDTSEAEDWRNGSPLYENLPIARP